MPRVTQQVNNQARTQMQGQYWLWVVVGQRRQYLFHEFTFRAVMCGGATCTQCKGIQLGVSALHLPSCVPYNILQPWLLPSSTPATA